MNILIIGSGGREHGLANAYSKSKKVKKVFVAPGNGLIDYKNEKCVCLPDVQVLNFDGIVDAIKKHNINFVDVAQDDPLAAGFVDKLQNLGIQAFGPTQKAAEIEWSKKWSRNFMVKYGLPIPKFKSFSDKKRAVAYVKSLPPQVLYIKASGLALGKGAIRAENHDEAIEAIKSMKQFGKAGETFLIEECLVGEEFSLFTLCDGKDYKIVGYAQDHKTAYDQDQGPNTGGMGCVSPTNAVDAKIIEDVEKTALKPFIDGMQQEVRPYTGVLYFGGIKTSTGIKTIEFNARWGDPEAEVILPSIQTDYLSLVEKITMKQLNTITISFDKKTRVSIAGCSKGYPIAYSKVKGKEIFGLEKAQKIKGISIFGAGIKRERNKFFANGGRVFHLVAEGKNILDARKKAYKAMKLISIDGNNLHYRTDIGWRDMERLKMYAY